MIFTDLVKYPNIELAKEMKRKIEYTRALATELLNKDMITPKQYNDIQSVCDGCSLQDDVLAECEKTY